MLENLPRPIIFAHRGDAAHAPENTLAAFKMAQAKGAGAIELDAKLSADGQVFVFHDKTLERTTNGTGRLSDKTAEELRALDAGGHISAHFRGEKIPFLSEVLECFKGQLLIDIEFKTDGRPFDCLVRSVCALVVQYAAEGSVLFSSFEARSLELAASLLPQVPRALIARPLWAGAWARSFGFSFGDYAALHPYILDGGPHQVRRVHRLKRRIHVWGVNDRQQMRQLFDWGVDGIFTRDPLLALEVARGSA
jgi:glycerophosphoryl diester phosphodiesterase